MRRGKSGAAERARAESRGTFAPPSRGTQGPDLPRRGSGSRMAVRNWRVATRLNAILLIPVLVALVFGGFRVKDSVTTWNDAQDAERTAELVRAAAAYGNALIDERDRTAAPLLAGHPDDPGVERARAATDRAKSAFDAAAGRMPRTDRLERRLAAFRKVEPELAGLRRAAYTSRLSAVRTEEGYVKVQHPLMEFANELGFGTGNITAFGRTVYSIELAQAAESLERSIGTHLLVKPGPGDEDRQRQLTAFASYAYLEGIALEEYAGGGTSADVALLHRESARAEAAAKRRLAGARDAAQAKGKRFVTPPAMDDMVTAIGSGASPAALRAKGVTADTWFAAATAKFGAYRAAEQTLAGQAVDEAERISAQAERDTYVNLAVVVVSLLLAFVIAGLMARSMSRSMQRLRGAAFDVAEQRLPMLVDQLSRTEPGQVDTRVAPIPIDSRDEIGEVARAFDHVHREAVRLAAEQALLRGNVNAIFTNLSRRNQGLIERQLELISDLENNEADPDQLESLFGLDHLATRMRRNGENLLVLAGEEPDRRGNQPVSLVDILRAASSEVEHYARIELSGAVPGTEIHGQVVNDLVHLLAELLENATSFSSPHTKVQVTATRLPDGRVMIEIHDKGIGLTAEDFADINHKLANPPTVDAAVSQRMGLYVVGRLADRHGIRVQLRPSGRNAGTTSLVMLPAAITRGGGGDGQGGEEQFTVSRIMREHPDAAPTVPGPQRSAADLGFDDTRYGGPAGPGGGPGAGGGPGLDPLSRSLHREERRAALEAQQGGRPAPARPDAPQYEVRRDDLPGGRHAAPPAAAAGPARPELPAPPLGGRPPQGPRRQPPDQAPHLPRPAYEQPQVPPYEGQYTPYGAQAESSPGVAEDTSNRVGFDHPGSPTSGNRSTTGAGLPRRPHEQYPQAEAPEAQQPPYQAQPEPAQDWRSANDERWNRAEQLRAPQVGGVTSSGLPRRVPRANLVEGTAEQNPRGGPMVSRDPEDVRGRLSNLHRGVRRGRSAGDAPQNDRQGYGPGSTYDQER